MESIMNDVRYRTSEVAETQPARISFALKHPKPEGGQHERSGRIIPGTTNTATGTTDAIGKKAKD
jgi:hypothetical protein